MSWCVCIWSESRGGTRGLPFVWAMAAKGWIGARSRAGDTGPCWVGDPELGLILPIA